MDDVALLRRTIRRCTAVLVTAVGVATWAIAGIDTARFGFVLALSGLLYLAGSLILVPQSGSTVDGASDTSSE
jgi:hypothetical protein